MLWWKEIDLLKRQLTELQTELEKEEGKVSRLSGFLRRLQTFGVSSSGQIHRREFDEALLDSLHALLKAEEIILFRSESGTSDLLPAAGRGFAPEILARLRVRIGEGTLGRAAQDMKTIVENKVGHSSASDENFLTSPYILIPLVSQGLSIGLLLIAKPAERSFSAEAKNMAALFAAQGALVLEDHGLFEERERLREHTVTAISLAIEAKDTITHRHSQRTRALVRAITQEVPLPEFLIRQIEFGAFLHDVGKIGIEDSILKKTGPLTPEEYAIMKTHPQIGLRIVQPLEFLRSCGAIILYHQEWYNGAGYPEGLAGEEIPLGARIVQIIDAWDAMTSDRPYRKAMTKTAAITELRRQAGTQFDPKLVELFLRVIDRLEREGIPTTEQAVEKPLATQPA